MRSVTLSILALAAVCVGTVTSASAKDYAYCLQGAGYGIPGDCSYTSYGQCKASASGRLADCNVNPRYAGRRSSYRSEGSAGYGNDFGTGRRQYVR